MKKRILFLSLLLIAIAASGEPIVRIVRANGLNKSFATDNVRKLVLSTNNVDVIDNENSLLLSVSLAEIVRVELTEGTPDSPQTAAVTVVPDSETIKIIENSQVYIIRCGRKYTVTGIEVEQ